MNTHPIARLMSVIILVVTWCISVHGQDEKSFVPDWVKDAVFYQIFPERFANGDTTNDPPDKEPWGGTPKVNNYFGGDLKGVTDHLDYLQDLGINAIYFNPIFESPSNHKYHTSDYMKIDHNFGNDTTFKELLDECHRRGIRVVIDGVFNHTGVHFWAFEDIKKNEAESKYLKWYDVKSFPVGPPDKPNYEAWWGLGDLPKLMTDNPEVRKYLFGATTKWTKMGIDGWRLDVPNEMSHDFWIQWRKLVKKLNPDAYIVGEIWDDATPWLQGDQFDAVMNYRFRGACVGFIALENLTASQFDSILAVQRAQYPDTVNFVLQNLLGSHDTERFLTLSDGDDDKLKLSVLMQMTYPGAPMVYYGDEIGMEGGKDPDCRKTMVWDKSKWNTGLLAWYKRLIRIRNENPVLRRGSFTRLDVDNKRKTYWFIREFEGTKAVVILNNTPFPQPISPTGTFFTTGNWRDLLLDVYIDTPIRALVVPARSGIILLSKPL
jgi:glycosidase